MDIQVMEDILHQNDVVAQENRKLFRENKILAINLLGSPGCGKTTLLENILSQLKDEYQIAVIEGDLFTDKDADRIKKHNILVKQINTHGGCHLDALMVKAALSEMEAKKLDLIIIENVGNLVCPAEFDVGEDFKITALSITEGDDKPLKYPIIFKESEVAILNKIDILPFTNFSVENATEDLLTLHPKLKIFNTVATKYDDEGVQNLIAFIKGKIKEKRKI